MPRAAADALGVAVVTLGQWRARGMQGPELAVPGQSKFGRTWFYHVAGCTAWKDRNVGAGVGGKREGAGRPRKGQKRRDGETRGMAPRDEEGLPRPAPPIIAQAEANRSERLEREAREEAARLALEQRKLTDPRELARMAGSDDTTRVQVQNRKDLIAAGRVAVELQEKLGELVENGKVMERWAGDVAMAVEGLKRLGPRQADRIAARLGLSPEQRHAVLGDLTGEIAQYQSQTWDQIQKRRIETRSV